MLVRRLVRQPPFPRTKHGIAEKNRTPYLPEKLPNSNIIPAARLPNGNVTACCLKEWTIPGPGNRRLQCFHVREETFSVDGASGRVRRPKERIPPFRIRLSDPAGFERDEARVISLR